VKDRRLSKADEYRARARKHEDAAAQAQSEEVRRELEQLALALRALADRLDRQ
jgi:hypothetical protein